MLSGPFFGKPRVWQTIWEAIDDGGWTNQGRADNPLKKYDNYLQMVLVPPSGWPPVGGHLRFTLKAGPNGCDISWVTVGKMGAYGLTANHDLYYISPNPWVPTATQDLTFAGEATVAVDPFQIVASDPIAFALAQADHLFCQVALMASTDQVACSFRGVGTGFSGVYRANWKTAGLIKIETM
jgi:hypothetical protein